MAAKSWKLRWIFFAAMAKMLFSDSIDVVGQDILDVHVSAVD